MSSFLSQALPLNVEKKKEKPEKSLSVCFLKMIFMNENLLSDDVIGFDCDDEFIYLLAVFIFFHSFIDFHITDFFNMLCGAHAVM